MKRSKTGCDLWVERSAYTLSPVNDSHTSQLEVPFSSTWNKANRTLLRVCCADWWKEMRKKILSNFFSERKSSKIKQTEKSASKKRCWDEKEIRFISYKLKSPALLSIRCSCCIPKNQAVNEIRTLPFFGMMRRKRH